MLTQQKKGNKYASKERYFSLAKMALEELRNTFINVFGTKELMETLIDKLPFKEFKVVSVQGSVKKFKANVECNIQDVSNFISVYNEKSQETLRVSKVRKLAKNSSYEKYTYLRYHHITRYHKTMNAKEIKKQNPSKRFKNTDFSLILRFFKNCGDKDGAIFNSVLDSEWTHNHPTHSLQALSFKDIAESTQVEITKLFERGFTPGLAYKEFWKMARQSCKSEVEVHKFTSDRAVFPIIIISKYGSKLWKVSLCMITFLCSVFFLHTL